MQTSRLPTPVAWLGYGGLLPFLGFAALSMVEPTHGIIYRGALLAYGAVILSFVGALHWAFAMTSPTMGSDQRAYTYMWSVVPALMAWLTYFLTVRVGAALIVLGFIAQFLMDQRIVKQIDLPAWYLPLRLRLTIVACVSIIVGLSTHV